MPRFCNMISPNKLTPNSSHKKVEHTSLSRVKHANLRLRVSNMTYVSHVTHVLHVK